ncbi:MULTISPECIES: septation protein A [unclassified Avibacterium]|uniref:septation protein A n=1 Tax=unclassified Avibacterium TaxID=2685287 RepID=UPI0020274630|nr:MULTISPECIES: septation protein A [unclassified Avibacterium]MCW9698309.1 septation protein A [Avibacterium sp. 20-129]MCW9734176.1 septation protein A [Avibacterium sp. 20-15]URL03812.1 septation protein A [Avibacterium sp. 20-132]URL07446.1 septation protein A [Avibacterium sp. 21-595]
MKQILEFIPLLVFFIVYKLVGIREAAIALIIATVIQLVVLKVKYGKIEKQQLIMGSAVVFFGALSAYFNELAFLKWKVTVIYALFALALIISQVMFNKPLIQQLLGKEIQLPDAVWYKLNMGWACFFLLCMVINIIISQYFSDDIWVDFKTFGIIGLSLIATVATGVYIYRYLPQTDNKEQQ